MKHLLLIKNVKCVQSLRRLGDFNDDFVTYLLLDLTVKACFENRSAFGIVMGRSILAEFLTRFGQRRFSVASCI